MTAKQGILEILNLEDHCRLCAFAIERSGGLFSWQRVSQIFQPVRRRDTNLD